MSQGTEKGNTSTSYIGQEISWSTLPIAGADTHMLAHALHTHTHTFISKGASVLESAGCFMVSVGNVWLLLHIGASCEWVTRNDI